MKFPQLKSEPATFNKSKDLKNTSNSQLNFDLNAHKNIVDIDLIKSKRFLRPQFVKSKTPRKIESSLGIKPFPPDNNQRSSLRGANILKLRNMSLSKTSPNKS